MRKLTLGAAVIAATGCLSVPVIGLAGSTGTTGGGLLKLPVAAADEELPAFDGCDELLDWYVEKALPLVGPWGFGYGGYWEQGDVALGGLMFGRRTMSMPVAAAAEDAGATAATKAAYNSATGTNVQETGVDEPDVAKTDGKLIVHVDDRDLVVTDVTGNAPVELSRTRLPKNFWGEDLLLVGDRVLVTGQAQDNNFRGRGLVGEAYMVAPGNSRMLTYSISDPEKPALVDDREYEGNLVEARQYGDTVRLVIQTGYPQLDFVQPNRRRTESEARKENRAIVRESSIEDWLPTVVVDGVRSPLVGCDDVRHPKTNSGFGTISIVTFDAATPAKASALAVTTSGDLAYSSTDRLYVATPVDRSFEQCFDCGFWPRMRIAPDVAPAQTEIHAFELGGTSTTYVASGKVPGLVRDRWSFDEYDGHLRVATALTKGWETTDNAIVVLREEGSTLNVVGSVRHLGPREEIQSVRWFDDLAVVVTFRQMDPLYTVDLTDPTDPKVLGELKIPGFSSYLHPIGKDRLLGLGTAATKEGAGLGAQIATFDISDLKDPRQLSVLRLGREQELTASYDPRAFTFVGTGTAYTTVNNWDGHSHVIQLRISPSGDLTQVNEYPARYNTRVLPISGDRVALVGDVVRLVAG